MIGLYCPDVPPIPGGVADHTTALAHALERRGTPLAVFGRRGSAEGFNVPVRLGITPSTLQNALREFDIRGLFVQYVPFLYARFGVAPTLPPALARVRAAGTRVAVFVHEPYVPFTRLPWLISGVPQRLQLRALVRNADRVYTAVPAFADICRDFARGPGRVTRAPIGATLPVSPVARAAARERLGIAADTVAIGVFSPAASGYLLGWVRAAMDRFKDRRDVLWVLFGFGSAVVLTVLPANARVLGPLDAARAAETMRALDLMVAPYEDGMTMRRSSAMLGLASGIPLVTSTGPLFDPAMSAFAACEPDLPAFLDRLDLLVNRPTARQDLARLAAASAPVSSIDTLAGIVARDLEAAPQ